MELIEGSETSAYIHQTPGIRPKENLLYSEHGESLKSRTLISLKTVFGKKKTSFFNVRSVSALNTHHHQTRIKIRKKIMLTYNTLLLNRLMSHTYNVYKVLLWVETFPNTKRLIAQPVYQWHVASK
jgi:hypothetical protein